MSALPRPRAVLFDLDATLIEDGSLKQFIAMARRAFGPDLPQTCEQAVFASFHDVDRSETQSLQELLAAIGEGLRCTRFPEVGTLAAFWDAHFHECVKPAAGARALLERLRERGVKTGVVTNGGPLVQGRKVEAAGLGAHVDFVLAAGSVGCWKPHSRIFHIACSRLELAPGDVWFVGDDPLFDIQGAQAAGMAGVWKRRRGSVWPSDVEGSPSAVIDELSEILDLVDQATINRRGRVRG